MGDDDDDAGASTAATRYPCMPSLVALQQMRNRLHLAHLGKKLMKWTALATGKELRRIAEDLNTSYQGFGEDIRTGYIMLARTRYFYPNLNKMVVGNSPEKTGHVPYKHLALDKGGQSAKAAKDWWLELLKRMILMLQLRQGFTQIDEANKNATKRQNVLQKTVIPRIKSSIHYIIIELEELAREELYRIKKVVQYKKKKKEKARVKIITPDETQVTRLPCVKCEKEVEVAPIVELKPVAEIIELTKPALTIESKLTPVPSKEISLPAPCAVIHVRSILKEQPTPVIFDHVGRKLDHISKSEQTVKGPNSVDDSLLRLLERLKCHLRSVIDVTEEFREKVTISPSVEHFNQECEKVYNKVILYVQDIGCAKLTTPGTDQLGDLKRHITKVEEMTNNYKKQGILAPDAEEFLSACARVRSKIGIYENVSENTEKLEHLKEHVTDLEHMMTSSIKDAGIASNSIEDFLLACNEFKAKIELYKHKKKEPPPDSELTTFLDQLDTGIKLSKQAKTDGLITDSVDNLIKSCEDIKKRLKERRPQENVVLDNLRKNLDDILLLASNLKAKGQITASIEDLIMDCRSTRDKIDLYKRFPLAESRSVGNMILPACNTCNMPELEKDSEACDRCRKLWEDERTNREKNLTILPPCVSCLEIKPACQSCLEIKPTPSPSPPSPRYDGRRNTVIIVTPERAPKKITTISEKPPELITPLSSSEKPPEKLCSFCKISECLENYIGNEEEEEAVKEEFTSQENLEDIDNAIGFFETNVKTIVKTTRTLNDDGTINEEKEIITIRTERHDPNITQFSFVIGKNSEFNRDDSKEVGCLIAPDQNQRGFNIFPNKAKSEPSFRVSPMIDPSLRCCISIVSVLKADNSYLLYGRTSKSTEPT